jgi:hypothetical protein
MPIRLTSPGFTHEVEEEDGSTYARTFVGAQAAQEFGRRRRRVMYVRTLRGTVEYRRADAPEDD